MVRPSRTSGGTGLERIDDAHGLRHYLSTHPATYVGVAPYISDALPVNVGAVVWQDGLTLHPASVQLIGIPGLTARAFGYCGNDFGAVGTLARHQLDAIEDAVMKIGGWLRRYGYRGAFGVDFLMPENGAPLFMEVNPRFQGSTHASSQMSVEMSESCVMLDHVAAFLGMAAPRSLGLRDYTGGVCVGPLRHALHPPRPSHDRSRATCARRARSWARMPYRRSDNAGDRDRAGCVGGQDHGPRASDQHRLRSHRSLARDRRRVDRPGAVSRKRPASGSAVRGGSR